MTQFDEREQAYEAKFSHELELDFRAVMRRNKLLGLWAAAQMGLPEADADAYAKSVIEIDFTSPGHDDVLQKVFADLTQKGVNVTEHIVERKMEELLDEAHKQVRAGTAQ